MELTRSQILTVMPNARAKVDIYLPLLNRYMAEFKINTPLRVQYFLATIAVESAELRYTTELGSRQYFDKYDTGKLAQSLGNTQAKDGDGYLYRGRGLIQITGKANYEKYKTFCGFDVVANPDLLAQPLGATRSACWFFATHGCLSLSDADNTLGVRKAVNGGTNGIVDFKKYLKRAKLVIK